MTVYVSRIDKDPATGAPVYPARSERLFGAGSAMFGGRVVGGRSGVRPGGSPFRVTLAGLDWTVEPGICDVDGTAVNQGVYRVVLDASTSGALAARPPAGQSRKDLLVVEVKDAVEDATTTLREGRVRAVAGAASAGTPATPQVPVWAVRVATLTVPASGAVTIDQLYGRSVDYTVAPGGVLPCLSTARPAGHAGMLVYELDLLRLMVCTSVGPDVWSPPVEDTGWQTLVPASAPGWVQDDGNPGQVRRVGAGVRLRGVWTRWSTSGQSGTVAAATLPASFRPDKQLVLDVPCGGGLKTARLIVAADGVVTVDAGDTPIAAGAALRLAQAAWFVG